jgi:hypothetical protein
MGKVPRPFIVPSVWQKVLWKKKKKELLVSGQYIAIDNRFCQAQMQIYLSSSQVTCSFTLNTLTS